MIETVLLYYDGAPPFVQRACADSPTQYATLRIHAGWSTALRSESGATGGLAV